MVADVAVLTKSGVEFLARWGHFLAGITWIGLLYYFNFVQGAYFNEAEAGARSDATQKLVPRALWWFRWGAALTFLTGIAMIGLYASEDRYQDGAFFKDPEWVLVLGGAILGTIMFLNVWGVIWRNQKIVIANAKATAAGQPANPDAAAAARRGFTASRTNTLFSIPMLFFMGAGPHLGTTTFANGFKQSGRAPYFIVFMVITLIIEANALMAPAAGAAQFKPLEKHRDTIISGFVLTLIFYVVAELCLR